MVNLLSLKTVDKRETSRNKLFTPIPVAIKSEFSKVVYRNFFMKDYSSTGSWIEFNYSNDNFQYALLPILIQEHQKMYFLYLNLLNYKNVASHLMDFYNVVDNNLWLEIPCKIKRYEEKEKKFGLGLQFIR